MSVSGDRPSAPVMTDVARLAGVSHQTVSRVINNHPSVRESTRIRVQNAIDQLGYRRNQVARQLATGRSPSIGVVSVESTHVGPVSTVFAIAGAARRRDHFVVLAGLTEVDPAHMNEAIDFLMESAVDAILVLAPVFAAVDALRDGDFAIPVLRLGDTRPEAQSGLAIDQFAGARAATRHLLELGHRSVEHVSGPMDWLDADGRARGWRAELEAWSIEPPAIVAGDWSAESGYRAGRLLADRGDVTAVFAANDQMALGLMRALEDSGLEVPRDVSVVGFDDLPDSAYFGPALTTVRQDFAEVGRRSVEAALALVQGAPEPQLVPVRPDLLVRASTAPPRPR